MGFWKRVIKSIFLPGAVILLLAGVLIETKWLPVSLAAVNFFYYAVFICGTLLAWRFRTTRVLFCLFVLLIGHHAIEFLAQGHGTAHAPGRTALEAVALLIPLNFILLAFFPERGSEQRTMLWFLLLLFLESVFVAVAARPDQPSPGFLHLHIFSAWGSRMPQTAAVAFMIAIGFLLFRLIQFHRAIDSGMMWSLISVWMGVETGALGHKGTAYFGVAALMLASSIVENSYSLAFHDELTGLSSRRAYNDALLLLKHPYAVALVDIDHFKSINDTYGHDTGDQALRYVAAKIARVGGGGQAFRVGGEEFTVLFPGKTASAVQDYLELLRLNIENSSFRVRSGQERRRVARETDRRARISHRGVRHATSQMLQVTVSIGLAESLPKADVSEVIQIADKTLYRAKQGGRNRLEVAATAPPKRRKKSANAEKA
jgi:diguanylate cyclase (GGDEF)-like protein